MSFRAVSSSIVTSDVGLRVFSEFPEFSTSVPSEVISKGWISVFKFWRQGPFVDLRQCRVMVVGNKEVGKTSLVRALTNETHLAPHIPERTQGIDVNIERLEFSNGLVFTLWDFAGQEMYYLSHSIHFSRRCIFCLVWSHVHTSSSNESSDLELEVLPPLFTWLQMLCHNVPNAQIILVGSHSQSNNESFQKMNASVEIRVREEVSRLNTCLREEKEALHGILKTRLIECQQCQDVCVAKRLCDLFHNYSALLSFCKQPQFPDHPQLKQLQLCVFRCDEVRLRLCKICGRFDLSDPLESDQPSTMQIQGVLAVDSRDDANSVRQLRDALNEVGMKMPFIKHESQVPKWYRDVLDLVHEKQVTSGPNPTKQYTIGSSFLTRPDVTKFVQSGLSDPAVPCPKSEEEIWECLRFWSDLGEVFVCVCPCLMHGFITDTFYCRHEVMFLCDPVFLIDLLRPLVHYDVMNIEKDYFIQESSVSSARVHDLLRQLKDDMVVTMELLCLLKSWQMQSVENRQSVINFLQQCFLMTDLLGSKDRSDAFLVTARCFCEPTADDICDPDHPVNFISTNLSMIQERSSLHAFYFLPIQNVGLIARIHACIAREISPDRALRAIYSKNSVILSRSCHETMALHVSSINEPLHETFDSLRKQVPKKCFSCVLHIACNDAWFFEFAVKVVDEALTRDAFMLNFQCWQPDGKVYPDQLLSLKLKQKTPGVGTHRVIMLSENDETNDFCSAVHSGVKNILTVELFGSVFDHWNTFQNSRYHDVKTALLFAKEIVVLLSEKSFRRDDSLCVLDLVLRLKILRGKAVQIIVIPLHPCVFTPSTKRLFVKDIHGSVKAHRLNQKAVDLMDQLHKLDIYMCHWRSVLSYRNEKKPENLFFEQDGNKTLVACLSEHFNQSFQLTGVDLPDRAASHDSWSAQVEEDFDVVDEFPCIMSLFPALESSELITLGLSDSDVIGILDYGLEEKAEHPVSPFALLVARSCNANFKSAKEELYTVRSGYYKSLQILGDISDVCFYRLRGFPDHVIESCILNPQSSRELPYRKSKPIRVDVAKQEYEGRFLKGMCGSAPAFVRHWLEAAPSLTRAFCRVEGTDDVLLLEAMLTCISRDVQKKSDAWSDFTFSFGNDGQRPQLRFCCQKVPPSQFKMKCGGVCEFAFENSIRFLQDSFSAVYKEKELSYVWTDIVDNDLTAAASLSDLQAALGPKPYSDSRCVMFHRWKWGRAIENILLPPEAPLLFWRRNPEKSAEFTREVFETISKNFFPIEQKFESFPQWIISSNFLKVGCGWSAFNDYTVANFNDERHDERLRLVGHKLFSCRVVSAVYDLMHLNPETLAVRSSLLLCFFEMLQLISKEPGEELTDGSENKEHLTDGSENKGPGDTHGNKKHMKKKDDKTPIFRCFIEVIRTVQLPQPTELPDSISQYGDLRDHLNKFAKESWLCTDEARCPKGCDYYSKFCARHKSVPFWFRFPRLCSFLAHLCILKDAKFNPLKEAACDLLLLIQHAICVVMFDLSVDATTAPHSLLFQLNPQNSHRECPGFLPMVQREHKSGRKEETNRCAFDERIDFPDVTCASCGLSARYHDLRTQFGPPIRLETFFIQFARIGSIGWSSHDYSEIAIERGRRHIGFSFQVNNVKVDGSGDSQQQHRQRVEAVMREFQPQDAKQIFSECDIKILGDDGVNRVIDSMRQLLALRKEELQAVVDGIRMRLSPPELPAVEVASVPAYPPAPAPAPAAAPAPADLDPDPLTVPSPPSPHVSEEEVSIIAQLAELLACAQLVPVRSRQLIAEHLYREGVGSKDALCHRLELEPRFLETRLSLSSSQSDCVVNYLRPRHRTPSSTALYKAAAAVVAIIAILATARTYRSRH